MQAFYDKINIRELDMCMWNKINTNRNFHLIFFVIAKRSLAFNWHVCGIITARIYSAIIVTTIESWRVRWKLQWSNRASVLMTGRASRTKPRRFHQVDMQTISLSLGYCISWSTTITRYISMSRSSTRTDGMLMGEIREGASRIPLKVHDDICSAPDRSEWRGA